MKNKTLKIKTKKKKNFVKVTPRAYKENTDLIFLLAHRNDSPWETASRPARGRTC